MNFDTLLLHPSAVAAIKERFDNQLPMSFMGMRVVESPLARAPARKHKRRRWMSAGYHQRIQKKWNKRFGYVPCAFLVNTGALGVDFGRQFPPIFKRDLACFADPTARMGLSA